MAPPRDRASAASAVAHGMTVTFIAALGCDRIDASPVLDDSIDGEAFKICRSRADQDAGAWVFPIDMRPAPA